MVNFESLECGHDEFFKIQVQISEDKQQRIIDECKFLENYLGRGDETGPAIGADNNNLKSNGSVWLNEVYHEKNLMSSPLMAINDVICKGFIDHVVSLELMETHKYFGATNQSWRWYNLFSGYRAGDYYKPHRDAAWCSLIWFISPNDFEGGELYFPYRDVFACATSFTGIAFPSYYRHEVKKLTSDESGYLRYSMTSFIHMG